MEVNLDGLFDHHPELGELLEEEREQKYRLCLKLDISQDSSEARIGKKIKQLTSFWAKHPFEWVRQLPPVLNHTRRIWDWQKIELQLQYNKTMRNIATAKGIEAVGENLFGKVQMPGELFMKLFGNLFSRPYLATRIIQARSGFAFMFFQEVYRYLVDTNQPYDWEHYCDALHNHMRNLSQEKLRAVVECLLDLGLSIETLGDIADPAKTEFHPVNYSKYFEYFATWLDVAFGRGMGALVLAFSDRFCLCGCGLAMFKQLIYRLESKKDPNYIPWKPRERFFAVKHMLLRYYYTEMHRICMTDEDVHVYRCPLFSEITRLEYPDCASAFLNGVCRVLFADMDSLTAHVKVMHHDRAELFGTCPKCSVFF